MTLRKCSHDKIPTAESKRKRKKNKTKHEEEKKNGNNYENLYQKRKKETVHEVWMKHTVDNWQSIETTYIWINSFKTSILVENNWNAFIPFE